MCAWRVRGGGSRDVRHGDWLRGPITVLFKMSDPNAFTVAELKERLKVRGLVVAGAKSDLVARLMEADPAGSWMAERRGRDADSDGEDVECGDASQRREVDFYRRERELVERELELARREIAMLRAMQREDPASRVEAGPMADGDVGVSEMSRTSMRMNITTIADLLSEFDGVSNNFNTWEKQLRFLRATYRLEDDHVKVLIGMRLKKKALEWFHSRPEYLSLPLEQIIDKLRAMFQHRESRIVLRRKFESRVWKKDESFHEYVHEKIIMGNRVPIDQDELIEHIVDGIPDTALRDQARIQRFATTDALLNAFERVTLRDRGASSGRREERNGGAVRGERPRRADGSVKGEDGGRNTRDRRCFNCGAREHLSANCPTKEMGTKCFECGGYGHIALKCPKKAVKSKETAVASVSCVSRKKYTKEVTVDGQAFVALVDTGSDISIMRASEYALIGSPRLEASRMEFCGVGNYSATTLGRFKTEILIDGYSFPIFIYVVSDTVLRHGLLIGTDFLDSVEIGVKRGVISIKPIYEPNNDEGRSGILAIDAVQCASEIDVSHVRNTDHKRAVTELIANYRPNKLREIDIKMAIVLRDDEPVYQKARRLSQAEKDIINVQIEEWEKQGIVRPSTSDFASPVVLVKKKDNSYRLCVDYRLLNKRVVKDWYPLPLIEDQLDRLQNAKVFSVLDLKNGFFHVRMDEASIKYTSFVVPDGQFEFLRVPFGLCNSPAVFQRFINAVFRDLAKKKVVLTYLDDLIVLSNNEDDGLNNLKTVLDVASQAGLAINWRKCNFLQRRVEFLGHIVENGTIRPSELKTRSVMCFPEPRGVRQVQAFLGLSGYFRKFIPGYSIVARPLSNLLRAGERFQFGVAERGAFERLKTMLSERPVLSLYRVNAETELHTDASKYGYGAILLQRNSEDQLLHPVYYASGKTTLAEEKYTSYELEVLAIVRALKRFRVYLLGIPFKIVTDCQAFALTMAKKDLCVRVARWALLLEEFQYVVEHRPGKSMAHVDALSRNPLPSCLIVSECSDGLAMRLRKAQREDACLVKISEATERGEINDHIIRGGILYRETEDDIRMVIPKAMQTQIIRKVHEQGHFGVNKTETLVRADYWIPNLRAKVESVVANCVACILAEKKQGKQECFLNPIEKGTVPLDTFHIDHLGPLPSTKKSYNHIFVIVDAFSKFIWLYATKSTGAAEVVNRLKKQSSIFGNPRRIISDRGSAFTSREFEEYCQMENVQHVLTTTGIPRSNGQVERVNRTLIPLLTKLAAPKHNEWYKYLDIAQLCLNTTPHRSIKTTPFRVLFGVNPRIRDDPNIRELLEREFIASFDDKREESRRQARESIIRIQKENKVNFDKKRRAPFRYREGDLVAIRRTQQVPGLKLASKHLGPYEIVKVLRNDRYNVRKVGEHEGPLQMSSAADYMKPWTSGEDSDDVSEVEDSDGDN